MNRWKGRTALYAGQNIEQKLGSQLLVLLILIGQVLFFAMPSVWAAQDDGLQQGLAALSQNHLEVALDRLTAAEREHPSDARIRNFRGVVLARLGQETEAASEYREAVRLDPTLEDAYKNLGFLEWTEHRSRWRTCATDAGFGPCSRRFLRPLLSRTSTARCQAL